jgi:hypothetical protein
MTAAEKILQKRLITAGLSSADWDRVQAGLKDRAFWSARVQNVRFLQTAQQDLGAILANARNSDGALVSRAQIVSDLMRTAREEDISTGTGGLTDPGSAKRAATIVDTNAGLARGYTDFVAGNTPSARAAYPAWELIRVAPRVLRRDWIQRWTDAGGQLSGGRMIALKDDRIWSRISAFGNPWPPFDYGSGMGVADISFEECVRIGLVQSDWLPPANSNPVADFNQSLQESITFSGPNDPAWTWLKDQFGDQVKYEDGKIVWQADVIADAIANTAAGARTAIRFGTLTDDALQTLQEAGLSLPPNRLTTDTGLIRHALDRHGVGNEVRPDQLPLTDRDIALLPHVWRSPDRTFQEGEGICFAKRVADGEIRIIVSNNPGQIVVKSVYKKK